MDREMYVDLRCLQDPNYQFRGIGHHLAALLRTRSQSCLSSHKAIGLIDPKLPKLPPEFASLVNTLSHSSNPCFGTTHAIFIDGSPMTHDFRYTSRLLRQGALLKAAVLYDFIPLDWPGYLLTTASRIDYLAKMARLRHFDLFFPISTYTARRSRELLSIASDRITITGACVRSSLYRLREVIDTFAGMPYGNQRYFLTLGGGDKRKNTEAAVEALRRVNLLHSKLTCLKVVGRYDNATKGRLLQLAGHAEGAGFLEFHPDVTDEELTHLFAGAVATIAPSHIEGFSLPVVEASVCGCPVVASSCAAQLELVSQREALFQSDDIVDLAEKLEALLFNPSLRESLAGSQAHLAAQFHEDAVGKRFWSAIAFAVEDQSVRKDAVVARKRKPWLAFLSPFPPDKSVVARYTALTLDAGKESFHSDLYTDARRPLTAEGSYRDIGRVSVAPLISGDYDGIISVIGNSHFDTGIFEAFERHGGPCILHDGRPAPTFLRRPGNCVRDRTLAPLALKLIIERASPLIVHTVTRQAQIKKLYGVDAHVTTCCPTVLLDESELTESARATVRNRLGFAPADFVVSSFGSASREKGMECCLLAIDILRNWKFPVKLRFVGSAEFEEAELQRICALYNLSGYVQWGSGEYLSDAGYRDFLIASDAAMQFRAYEFGGLSASLMDCIGAGLPCVANHELAQSCEAPEYVLRVPDRFSPLQVAERLALIWETRAGRASRRSQARSAYLETHNFGYYGKRLLEILGVA